MLRLLQDKPVNENLIKILLCGMNIYWMIAKVVYNREHATTPVRGVLRDVCPVHGIWHVYKVCVTSWYKSCSPSFSMP